MNFDLLNHCKHGVFMGECLACINIEAAAIRSGLLYRRAAQ